MHNDKKEQLSTWLLVAKVFSIENEPDFLLLDQSDQMIIIERCQFLVALTLTYRFQCQLFVYPLRSMMLLDASLIHLASMRSQTSKKA